MTVIATGMLSAGLGLRMDLHEGVLEGIEPSEIVSLGPDTDDTLAVVDIPKYNPRLPGLIGRASLMDELWSGQYEAVYDLKQPEVWGSKGLTTAAMRVLMSRLTDYDIHAREVVFRIAEGNLPSMKVAMKLGARLAIAEEGQTLFRLRVQDSARGQKELTHA